MSNKSNDTGSLIGLPKGGGALSGLGEKFSPDLHTGTGNFSIPLALPAGRNGFQPQLTLSYSTGQGHGLFGLGWTLGLPGVSRKTSKGLPRYQDDAPLSDEADVFLLSGAEDLVPIEAPGPGRTRYRPRTEGLFAQIERHRNSAQATDTWEVRTKDGLTSFYGTNPLDAPVYPATPASSSGDPAVTTRPGSPERIFSWALTLTLDAFQNRIEYLYDRQRSGPGDEAQGHHWDVPVLKTIRYGDHGDRTSPGFLVTVEFEYEDRPDSFSDCRAGFEIRQTQRCRSILVKTHAGAERTVKEYRLRYHNDAGTLVSLLEAVEVYGFDSNGGPVLALPPLELSYTTFEPERRDRRNFLPVRGKELPVVSLAHPTLALVDLHGQGLPDLFELGETVRYWRNLGDGEFDVPRPMREVPAGLSLGDPGVQLMDADGDGRMDLMVTRESMSGTFPLRFGPTWDRRSFRRWDAAPSFDLKDPEVRFLDLTGDGVTDALRTGSRLECYFNQPGKGWHGSRWLERRPLAVFPDVVFSDPRVLTGDMNGDGLTDIVFVHNGSLCYWPSHGYGDFGPRIQMRNGPRLPADYDPKRLLLGDVNGDGLADLVYVDHRRVYLWINQSGNAWSAPIVIEGTPDVTNEDAIRLVDLLGSGVPGILWSSDRVEPGRPHYVFLDLTGGAKPYLLRGMRNNLGAETRVEYRPSTQFYLDDRRRGSTPWKTTLPFPVQTVARVEVMDTFSGGRLVTRYTYHHGSWDGHEREFRGFGRVEQIDAETFADHAGAGAAAGTPLQHTYSPPLLSKSWFHQGPVENEDGSWQELDYRFEQWSGKLKDELVLADLVPVQAATSFAAEVSSDHPIAYYRLNEAAGTTSISDASGNENHGALSSAGVTLGVPGLGAGDTAARFDGLGSGRIVVPDKEILNPKNITMEALVTWSGPNGFHQRILEKSFGTSRGYLPHYGLGILDGVVRAELTTGSPPDDQYVLSTSKVKPNEPTHLVATYDGVTVRIYIDGVLDTEQPASGGISIPPQANSLGIGNQVDRDRAFHGVIDEVAIYNTALSADRIRAHIAATGVLTSTQPDRIRRDAVRSLRGSLLRTELYALDGDPRQDRPYTVTETVFGFREEAPPEPARADRRRIFFPHARAQRTTQWERGNDPMTQVSFTHRNDEFGQPLAQTQIACPRGWRSLDQRPDAGYLATRALTTYAVPPSPQGPYIHDRVARSDSFEISATLGKTVAEIIALGDRDLSLRRIGQVLAFFDGAAFTGLALGTVGRHGAVSRTENLVLTPERMTNAYGTAAPPYLNVGTWTWPEQYPQAFRDMLPVLAGYVRHDGSEPGVVEGLFSVSQRLEHDFQQAPDGEARGLVVRQRDPMGHDTTITYDFELLPASVTDAAGMVTRAQYDLRFFQPSAVTDPNGNRQEFEFRPNGLLSAVRVRGKTATEGDQTRASLQYQYDLFAFRQRGAPVSVVAVRFLHHDSDVGIPTAERDATIESREYSDGFGRVLQSRAQGEDLRFGNEIFGGGVLPADQTAPATAEVIGRLATPGIPNVTVSGWQVYDNKGRVVEKHEPFFSAGWDYEPAQEDRRGQSVRMFYDPRGQVIRTVHPDGSEELVVHGVPGTIQTPELSVPTVYEPTPWEAYSYDANDNAGRTHPQASVGYQHCWNTPASIEIDALGRTIRAVERNRAASPSVPLPAVEAYTTRSSYDIQGNLLSITDVLHRVAFTHAYDLAKQPLHTLSLDAGERWFVLNAAGLALETRDSKGALQLQGHDALKRPVRLWARDAQADAVTLRATTRYGDELAPAAQPSLHNLLGKPYLAQDGAGRLTFSSYDFKGNLLEKTREVIADLAIAAQVNAGTAMARGFRVDWDQPPALEGSYTTSLRYDALNRITLTTLPADVKGNRQTLSPTYNRAGALESVSLAGQPYVRHLAYDAKGQRVLAAYGNGYLTRYAYDERTFRLARLRTETYSVLKGKLSPSPEVVTPGLMGWWRFDEPSGATVKDWSDFQNHGKLDNPNQVRQAGKIGNGLTFNGTSDCVDIPVNGMTFPGKAVTLSLWTYGDPSLPTATGYGSLVVSAFKTDGNVALTVSIPYTDGSIFFRAGSADGADTKSTGVLQASQYKGQWNHWVFTKNDEGFVHIYLNGSLVLADPNWGGFGCGTIATFRIGRGTPGKYDASSAYKGMLDEIRLYNYALSATDVTNLYRADSSAGGAPGYTPQAGVLQDFAYDYDLAGNILSIHDRSPNSGIRNAPLGKDALDRDFRYDALYRLTEATGRESMYSWPPPQGTSNRAKWDRSPQAQGTGFFAPGSTTTPDLAPEQTRAYTETYAYDPAGNLLRLWHGTSSSWTRHFGMGGLDPTAWDQAWPSHVQGAGLWANPPSNRLTHVGDNAPAAPQTHVFDACGNLVRENGSRHFAWNHADQLIAFSVRPNATAPASVDACYLYDSSGQRVKKWVRNQSGAVETTIYIDGVFERSTGRGVSNNTLHVMDEQSRIAMVRIGDPFPDEGAPDLAIKYHFGDHLGSSHVVVGVGPVAQNVLVNREEFYPYGETSYGGFGRKQYRFTGMERDEESGLQYHSARYYAPWLARWVSADPIGSRSSHLYAYATRNTLTATDRSGKLDQHNTDDRQSQDMASSKSREERVAELPESAWPMSHQEFSKRMGLCYNDCKPDSQGRIDPLLDEKKWVPSGPWKAWKGSWYQEGGSYEYADNDLSSKGDDPDYVMRSGAWYPYRMWANLQKQRSSLFDDTPRQPASIADRLFGWYLRDFAKNLGPPSETVSEAAAMVSSLMNTLLDLKTFDLPNDVSLGAVSTSVGDAMKLQAALTHKTLGAELGVKIGPSLGYGLGASVDRTVSGIHIYGGLGLSLSSYSRLFATGSESSAVGATMPLINAKLQVDWP